MLKSTLSACSFKAAFHRCSNTLESVVATLCCTAPGFAPALPGLTKLVKELAKEGAWEKALLLYEGVSKVGLQPDTMMTNAAIGACGDGRNSTRARRVFDEMESRGLEPDAVTYKALIAAHLACDEWQPCVKVRARTLRLALCACIPAPADRVLPVRNKLCPRVRRLAAVR
jgi:pentatricopeptide repeat protein